MSVSMHEHAALSSIAIVTGATTYPRSPRLGGATAFKRSAEGLRNYLLDPSSFRLPEENLLWLYDEWRSPPYQLEQMADFIRTRVADMKGRSPASVNLIYYHVGHGFFAKGDQSFCLATHLTSETNQAVTSIRVSDLARTLRESASSLSKYIILDCCFAATAVPVFQTSTSDIVDARGLQEFASRGTAILCSSSPASFSLAPTELNETMFSGSLLKALRQGDAGRPGLLSFQDLEELITSDLRVSYPADWVRPELHVPEQGLGDITELRIFPNPALPANAGLNYRQPTTCLVHPYPIQNNFTGRRVERDAISAWWLSGSQPLLSLVAMGGMGKSAVSWVWVQRELLGNRIPGTRDDQGSIAVPPSARPEGVFWWSFYEGDADFNNFVQHALEYVGRGYAQRGHGNQRDMQKLLELLASANYLLVLDGFERELAAFSELSAPYQNETEEDTQAGDECTNPVTRAFLRAFVSLPMRSRILMTTRVFPRELEQAAGCQKSVLSELALADGIAFLRAQGVTGNYRELEEACMVCGSHPLALRLLAGVVVNNPAQPGNVRPVLEMRGLNAEMDIIARRRHVLDLAYCGLVPSHQRLLSQMAAFRFPVSYAVLKATLGQREAGGAAGLFRWVRQAIHNEAFFHKQRDLDRGLRQLVGRGLLFLDHARAKYDLHPIVRSFAYDKLADKAGVHTQFRNYFNLIPPQAQSSVTLEELKPMVELYHHTVRAGYYSDAFRLFRDRLQEPLLQAKCDLVTYTSLVRALISEDTDYDTLVRDTEDEGLVLTCLAHSYYLRGIPGKAIPIYQKCLASQRSDWRLSRKLSPSLITLSLAEIAAGEFESAEQHLQLAVSNGTKGRGTDFTLLAREILAELYLLTGQAKEYMDQRLQLLGTDHGTHYFRCECIYKWTLGQMEDGFSAAVEAYRIASSQSHFELLRCRLFVCWFVVSAVDVDGEWAPSQESGFFDLSDILLDAIDVARRGGIGEMEIDGCLSLAQLRVNQGDLLGAKELVLETMPVIEQAGLALLHCRAEYLLGLVSTRLSDGSAQAHLECAQGLATRFGCKYTFSTMLERINMLLTEVISSGNGRANEML
jgi:tetratricopeptide (TPR) repeat protein